MTRFIAEYRIGSLRRQALRAAPGNEPRAPRKAAPAREALITLLGRGHRA